MTTLPESTIDPARLFPRHSLALRMTVPVPEEGIAAGEYVVLSPTAKATAHSLVAVRGEPGLRRVVGATSTRVVLEDGGVVERGEVVGVVVGVVKVMEVEHAG